MSKQVASVGRIVHYVLLNGVHRPAIIVHVWNGDWSGKALVQLQVFMDGDGGAYNDCAPNVVWRTSVVQDEEEKKPGTWHFPEYVGPSGELPASAA